MFMILWDKVWFEKILWDIISRNICVATAALQILYWDNVATKNIIVNITFCFLCFHIIEITIQKKVEVNEQLSCIEESTTIKFILITVQVVLMLFYGILHTNSIQIDACISINLSGLLFAHKNVWDSAFLELLPQGRISLYECFLWGGWPYQRGNER